MWLLYVSCALVAGVFLGSRISPPLLALPLGLIPFLLMPLLPNTRKVLLITGLCLFALLAGGFRFPSTLSPVDEHCLCFYNDRGTVEVKGMVAEEPDIRHGYCLLKFSASEIAIDGETKEVAGTALIRVPRYPLYRYGDVLEMTGKLATPPQFPDFDYRNYLAGQGIYSVVYYPRIEVLETGQGFNPLQWIHLLREYLSVSLARALPEPQGSLAQGILLGLRGNIPDALHQAFSRTGTAHLLAISGLHVGIIAAMLLSFGILVFGRQRSIYIWLALAIIWLYVLLIGMRPPIMRAAIMGSLFLVAEYLGRQRSAIIALAFDAAVMVGIQPNILWSVSFQLSFTAMAGLALLFPHFQAWARKGIAAVLGDREALVTTGSIIVDVFAAGLAAVVAVWPLIAYNFGIVSLVTLPATFFSLPALPFIIVTAALVAFAGLLSLLAAQVLGWLAWLFLSYLILVVRAFDALPYSSVEVTAVAAWHVWIYYVVLAGFLAVLNHRRQLADFSSQLTRRTKSTAEAVPGPRSSLSAKWLVPPLLVVVILVWSMVLTMPGDKLHVSFLDVGQGDAVLLAGSQ